MRGTRASDGHSRDYSTDPPSDRSPRWLIEDRRDCHVPGSGHGHRRPFATRRRRAPGGTKSDGSSVRNGPAANRTSYRRAGRRTQAKRLAANDSPQLTDASYEVLSRAGELFFTPETM